MSYMTLRNKEDYFPPLNISPTYHVSVYTYICILPAYKLLTLTEGMAKISDAADVNALACRRSDTRPATTPPVYM